MKNFLTLPNPYNKKQIIYISAIIVIFMVASGMLFSHNEKKRIQQSKYLELKTINNFKATQIDTWLNERFADALHFSTSPLYADALIKILNVSDTTQQNKIAERNELIRKLRGYADVQICVNHSLLKFSTLNKNAYLPPQLFPLIDSALTCNKIILSGFLTDTVTKKTYLSTISPITDQRGKPFATLIFYIDPETNLFKLLSFSPGDYKSQKSILFNKEKGKLHAVNQTHDDFYPLYLSAIQNSVDAIYSGKYDTNVKVIASLHPLKNAPWYVITQLNEDEALKEYRFRVFLMVFFFVLMLTIISIVISWLHQIHKKKTFKSLLENEQLAVTKYQTSEARFRAVIENSSDAILFIDKTGMITYCGQAIQTITGFTPEEITGQLLGSFISNSNEINFNDYLSKLQTSTFPQTLLCQLKSKSPELVWAEITFNNQTATPHLNTIVANIRNIQDRKMAEDEVAQNENRLKSIVKIMQYPNDNMVEFLDYALEEALKLSQSAIGYIYYYDEETQLFTLNSWSKNVISECEMMNPMTVYELEKTGLWGEVIRQRKPIIVNNYMVENPLKKGYPHGHVSLQRFLSIPIFSNDKIVAVIGVANKAEEYNSADILQLTLLMDAAWKVIETKSAQTTIKSSEEKYRKLFENLNSGFAFHRIILDKNNQPVDFEYIDINKKYATIWDCPMSIIGKTVKQVFAKAEQRWIDDSWHAIQSNKVFKTVNYLPEKDKYIDTTLYRIDNLHFAAIFNDITERIKAEETIKSSEARFRSIVENIPIGLAVLDLNGVIKYQNPATYEYLGYELNEINTIDHLFGKVFPDEEYRRMALVQWEEEIENLNHKQQSFSLAKTYSMINKEGEKLEIEITYALLSSEIFILLNNITETIRAEIALNQSETQYQMLFNNMPSGLVVHQLIFDDNNKVSDIRFIDINPAFETIFGITMEQTVGKRLSEINSMIRNEELLNTMAQVSESGNSMQITDYSLNNNKHIQWIFFSYQKDFVVGIVNDVTEKVNTENELRLSQQKFADIYSLVPDAIGITKASDGTLIEANPSYSRLTGYTPEEFLDKTTNDLGLWLTKEKRLEFLQVYEQNEEVIDMEIEMKIKDQSITYCTISARPITYQEEDCILFVIHDISDLKKSQKALINEQAFTNALLDSVPGLVYLYDENAQLVRWNKKHIIDTGYTEEELNKKSIYSWYDSQNIEIIKSGLSQVYKTGYGEAEAALLLKDGSTKQYYFSAAQIVIDNKLYIAGIGLDISARKLANEALKQIEQRFLNVYNLTPDMVGISRISDGIILTANPAASILTGYSHEELEGYSTIELGLWADPNARDEMVKQLKTKGEIINLETGMRLKDGSVLTCHFSARPLIYENQPCLLFVVHNISERKKAEELLKTNQARLRKAQYIGKLGYSEQVIGDPLSWFSAESKRIFGFEAIDGFINENEIAKCILDIPALQSASYKLIETGEKFDLEFYIKPIDGSEIKCLHGIQEIEYDPNNKPYKLITIFHDITERKKIELEIRQLNETLEKRIEERTHQLAQLNKDLEAFAYSVSHDLRAPLRHVDGFIKLLYNQINAPSPQINNYFQKIVQSSQRMSAMIDDLLSFSRLGRREIVCTSVDMNELVREIIDQLAPDIAARNIQWDISTLPAVSGDRSLLRMAFENIISNAIKYTRKKELAVIEIGSVKQQASYHTIYIKDNGIGFDMSYADKLFGVFQRLHTNEDFEGTGIGLANVKQIISKHGGTVNAMGKIDEGATFFINLPV